MFPFTLKIYSNDTKPPCRPAFAAQDHRLACWFDQRKNCAPARQSSDRGAPVCG